MKTPKMIIFDYGQTLIKEKDFDPIKGNQAILDHATVNKYSYTAEDLQIEADRINQEVGRFTPERLHLFQVEIPNYMFTSYLYRSMGIELDISSEEIDKIFWDAASPGKKTDGVEEFLEFLAQNNIRTAVISNITYCSKVVKERINDRLPDNKFEFIIASSDYLFRKPNKRIFDLALEMAQLSPEDVWYVGDNYKCDVIGSKNAGMFPVWYVGAAQKPIEIDKDTLTIHHWNELKEYILSTDDYLAEKSI